MAVDRAADGGRADQVVRGGGSRADQVVRDGGSRADQVVRGGGSRADQVVRDGGSRADQVVRGGGSRSSIHGTVRIGTRRSPLAVAQAESVAVSLRQHHPGLVVELVLLQTLGDRKQDQPLTELGTPGVFVREVQQALLAGAIDLAVHSGKDLPSVRPPGLVLAAFPEREDGRDALVLAEDGGDYNPLSGVAPAGEALSGVAPAGEAPAGGVPLAGAPEFDLSDPALGIGAGFRLGTSSVRRTAVIRRRVPAVTVLPVRGNVGTRLSKLAAGEYDGLVLAAAGLKRLGLAGRIAAYINPRTMIPAVAQGALAVEARADDEDLIELLQVLNHRPTEIAVRAEQSFLRVLAGTCLIPTGATARLEGQQLVMRGFVADTSGDPFLESEVTGTVDDPEGTGRNLAGQLLAVGAREVLARYR